MSKLSEPLATSPTPSTGLHRRIDPLQQSPGSDWNRDTGARGPFSSSRLTPIPGLGFAPVTRETPVARIATGQPKPSRLEDLRIPDFEILARAGQGSMGVVYRARQLSLNRIVALKILTPHLAQDPRFMQRFLREARMSAKLNHIHLINGIQCGESRGVLYYAMEYVEGETAQALLRRKGRFSSGMAVRIVLQVAEALDYGARFGLVHRDIKPENILVGADGIAKLCDLGLSKLYRHSDPSLTQGPAAIGTPHYMSPEQARGEPTVDSRADIYALGATLFHFLAGRPPFLGENGPSLLVKHLTEAPPLLRDLAPDLPPGLSEVVERMLAKRPEERYGDWRTLMAELTPFDREQAGSQTGQEGSRARIPPGGREGTSSHPGGRRERLHRRLIRRASRQRQGGQTLLLMLLLLACLALGMLMVVWHRQSQSKDGAGRPPPSANQSQTPPNANTPQRPPPGPAPATRQPPDPTR